MSRNIVGEKVIDDFIAHDNARDNIVLIETFDIEDDRALYADSVDRVSCVDKQLRNLTPCICCLSFCNFICNLTFFVGIITVTLYIQPYVEMILDFKDQIVLIWPQIMALLPQIMLFLPQVLKFLPQIITTLSTLQNLNAINVTALINSMYEFENDAKRNITIIMNKIEKYDKVVQQIIPQK